MAARAARPSHALGHPLLNRDPLTEQRPRRRLMHPQGSAAAPRAAAAAAAAAAERAVHDGYSLQHQPPRPRRYFVS